MTYTVSSGTLNSSIPYHLGQTGSTYIGVAGPPVWNRELRWLTSYYAPPHAYIIIIIITNMPNLIAVGQTVRAWVRRSAGTIIIVIITTGILLSVLQAHLRLSKSDAWATEFGHHHRILCIGRKSAEKFRPCVWRRVAAAAEKIFFFFKSL